MQTLGSFPKFLQRSAIRNLRLHVLDPSEDTVEADIQTLLRN
jgi:hypothetical protein